MLKEKLLEDLKESMKEKNVIRKNVVQMVRAAILQIEKDKKIEVSDSQIVEIIAKEAKKRKDALEDYQKSGREDLIEQMNQEIKILNEYLPKQLTEEELTQKMQEIITKKFDCEIITDYYNLKPERSFPLPRKRSLL